MAAREEATTTALLPDGGADLWTSWMPISVGKSSGRMSLRSASNRSSPDFPLRGFFGTLTLITEMMRHQTRKSASRTVQITRCGCSQMPSDALGLTTRSTLGTGRR